MYDLWFIVSTTMERFEANDIVYVFFPQKKKGCTPKFTSFWRGPFNILGKLSEVLYEVDCGRNNEPQIVVPTPTYLQEQVSSQGACHKQDLKELMSLGPTLACLG
jgi:hypothetical protein